VTTNPGAVTVLPDRPGLPPFFPDAHRPCDPDVKLPVVTRSVKPQYSATAMRDRAQGRIGAGPRKREWPCGRSSRDSLPPRRVG
jgi:hypothetical protein